MKKLREIILGVLKPKVQASDCLLDRLQPTSATAPVSSGSPTSNRGSKRQLSCAEGEKEEGDAVACCFTWSDGKKRKKKKQETKTDDGVVQARTKETDGHVSKEKK